METQIQTPGCGSNTDAKVAVIDPANDADVERLFGLLGWTHPTPCNVLRNALTRYAAGEGVTPPLTVEPTDLAARVIDRHGDEWARIDDGWVTSGPHLLSWGSLLLYGPLCLAEPTPTPDPWASYYDRDLTVEDLVALPVGSVARDCDDDEATKHANGAWGYGEWAARDATLVRYYAPIRLVSVGGEGK